LVKIILVKPTFLEKAGRLFSFGTIPKFINSNIENANNLQELSLLLFLDKSEINKYAPRGYELEV
jgi:hypothetical protein